MAEKLIKILIIEDEPSQLELLTYNLNVEGYHVLKAETGEEGLLLIKEHQVDLVVLDWMLPDISGIEICRQIRANKSTSNLAIIMLTARGEEEDKIKGLNIGANDYVVKPYSIKELLARVRTNLRIQKNFSMPEVMTFENIRIDIARHTVSYDGSNISLGPIEYKLLYFLMSAPRQVFSRKQLLDRVWESNTEIETRTVDVHIGRLRKSLKEVSNKNLIRTIRGFGYSLDSVD